MVQLHKLHKLLYLGLGQVLFRLPDCDTTNRDGKANDGNTEGTDHTELLGQSTGPQQDQPTQNILKPCCENENNFR